MTLLELINSLDERGIKIEVNARFVASAGQQATAADVEVAKANREELIRYSLALGAMDEVLRLEQEWAGYPGRRTPELAARIQKAKNRVLYLLPEDLPWDVVARLRPDGTTVMPTPELQGVA